MWFGAIENSGHNVQYFKPWGLWEDPAARISQTADEELEIVEGREGAVVDMQGERVQAARVHKQFVPGQVFGEHWVSGERDVLTEAKF